MMNIVYFIYQLFFIHLTILVYFDFFWKHGEQNFVDEFEKNSVKLSYCHC